MSSHFKRPSSTIEPHREKLLAHVSCEVAKGYTRNAAADTYAKKHGLHWVSVRKWLRNNFVLTQPSDLTRMKGALAAHLFAGGTQLEFAQTYGFNKPEVSRLSRALGLYMKLVHESEWAEIVAARAKKAKGGES